MKTRLQNGLKLVLVVVFMLSIGVVSAQTTTTSDTKLDKVSDETKVVRLIDNKGTIKYLQSKNGITQITSTSAGNRTTTTWQLGGTLTDSTAIDINGNAFRIIGDNFQLGDITETTLNAAATADAVGFSLLVRNETTGRVEKLLASEFIESAQTEYLTLAADETANSKDLTLDFVTTVDKILVFRNGAKLRAGTDYTLAANGLTLTVQPPSATGAQGWVLYADDIIEYSYTK